MAKTLVGIFDDRQSAQTVVQDLQSAGISSEHVRMLNNQEPQNSADGDDQSWTEKVSHWFRSLFDEDDDRSRADDYAEAWRRGHFLVVADVEGNRVEDVVSLMNRHGAIDVE